MTMAMAMAMDMAMDMGDGGWRRSDLKRVQVQLGLLRCTLDDVMFSSYVYRIGKLLFFFSIYHVSFNLTSISGNMFCGIFFLFFDFSQFLNSCSLILI